MLRGVCGVAFPGLSLDTLGEHLILCLIRLEYSILTLQVGPLAAAIAHGVVYYIDPLWTDPRNEP